MSIVTIVYIAISVVFLYLVPPAQIASDRECIRGPGGRGPVRQARGYDLHSHCDRDGPGSLAAILMASPRVYYAMARDGLFFPAFATVDPSRGTPTRAVALQAVLAIGARG